jgi:PAS domain S-box-containing protein
MSKSTRHEESGRTLRDAIERYERFRSVVNGSRDVIYRVNLRTGRFEYISPSAETVVGFTADELMAMDADTSLAMIHPEDLPAMRAALARMNDTGQEELEYRQRTRTGAYRWMSNQMSLVRDHSGEALYRDGNIRDVTERKRSEEALRAKERQAREQAIELSRMVENLRRLDAERQEAADRAKEERDRLLALINSIRDEVWLVDASRNLTLANPSVMREFLLPDGTLDAEKIASAYEVLRADGTPRPLEEAPPFRALRGETVDGIEEIVRTPATGQLRHRMVTAGPIRDTTGRITGSVAVVRDVTELKRTEGALREANARLAEADRRKDEFIAILSHELRNPLAPIRYALPVLAREQLGESGARAVQVIGRQVDHLTRLVDDLLDVSRITRGQIDLKREYVNVATVLSEAVESASPAIAAARHTLKMAVTDEPIWLHADPARLAQVVTNLLNNSAKYTPRGGEIRVEARQDDGHAIISVRDTGIGIPEHALSTLFEMFRQVDHPNKSQGGLGIGLALSKRLIEMHGGSIEARSAGAGHGAEFVVRLPVAGVEQGQAIEQRVAPSAGGRRLKVLVVDDNADLVDMLALVVSGLGHDVRKALDGQSAVSAARSYRPDVVLLDLGLPAMSGMDVARELRRHKETADARLVALTGWGQAEDRRQTEEAGFDHHLTKPTDPATLAELLARFAAAPA